MLTQKDILKHQESIKRESKTKDVNDDSFEKVAIDSEKKQCVAKRVFYNHEITEARGLYAARKATKKLSSASLTLQNATDVAQGFQREVERMNTNLNMHLQALIKEEEDEKDRIRLKAERDEKLR